MLKLPWRDLTLSGAPEKIRATTPVAGSPAPDTLPNSGKAPCCSAAFNGFSKPNVVSLLFSVPDSTINNYILEYLITSSVVE
jgi:hypothetical protein